MELLCGGVLLILLSFVTREVSAFQLNSISSRSLLSVVYLIVSGSLLTFPSYIWLLIHSTPARVSTYAYVNPIVAITLGWIIGGEALTLRTLTASLLVLFAIALILMYSDPSKTPQLSEVQDCPFMAEEPAPPSPSSNRLVQGENE